MRPHCVVLGKKQGEWHREPVQRQWIWEEIKSHATGEHLKRWAERLGLTVPLKGLEFKGSVQKSAKFWSQPFMALFPGSSPPSPCNKLQRNFHLLSFVWPARESWSSAVPFVLWCLCWYTCSKGTVLEIQQIMNGPIQPPNQHKDE